MKIRPKTIFTAHLLLLASVTSYCQGKIFKNTLIAGNIALSAQDKRFFDLRQGRNLLRLDYNHVDYELGISIQKTILTYRFIQFTFGIGFSQLNSNFPRPFDHSQLNGGFTDEPRIVKIYKVNQLELPLSGNFFLNSQKTICINVNFRPAFNLSKSAKDRTFDKKESKWNPEFRGFEILPGFGAKLGQRWWFNFNYRLYYSYRLDTVIFNHGLFFDRNPEFLDKKFDTYNPFQIQMTVGYMIK